MQCLALVLLALLSTGYALNENDPCTDPDGKPGRCIYFQKCDPIASTMRRGIFTPQQKQFITQSRCGKTVDNKNLVCCKDTAPESLESLPEAPKCGLYLGDRIVGGNATALDEFPWTALIRYRKPDRQTGFYCGGSLINSRYVLTAAHCIKAIPRNWNVIAVRLGEWDQTKDRDCDSESKVCSDPPVDVDIDQIIVHEEYVPDNQAQHNDIALIRLSRDVQTSKYIFPVCLPLKDPQRSLDYVGTKGYAVGWGSTENGQASDVKLKVQLEVKPLDGCANIYRKTGVVLKDTQLCAGGVKGEDTCTGDSGGPLTKTVQSHDYLVGIVSFGPKKCGTRDVPGVYTNVAKYVDWIKNNVRA